MQLRGGGVGGWSASDSVKLFASGKSLNCDGATKTKLAGDGGNSSSFNCSVNSFFFSDFLPAAMALHKQQGCWPSNVHVTASATEWLRRLSASIAAQATVCKVAQCTPVVATSATITHHLANCANTGTI